jgi:RND family efflux transporter MFP subunit
MGITKHNNSAITGWICRLALASTGAILFFTGCHQPNQSIPAPPLPTAAVKVQSVANQKYRALEEVIGTVHAKLRATIEAKISGRIEGLPVSMGQFGKAGDVLVLIDAREIQARLDQAKAVRDQAQQDLRRFATLLKQTAVTQQEFDAVQARARVADAAVTEAETLLGYARITAPFAGVVSHKLVDVGDLAAPGRPLLELEDPNALRLESDLPESLIDRVQPGQKMIVHRTASGPDLEGTVVEIAPAADPHSRTFRVKLDLPTSPELRIGQFGRLLVPTDEINSIRIPASAVVVRGQMELVFVVDHQHAHLRLVKTGKKFGPEIEAVSGLAAGEAVVTEGASSLLDDQPVEVK